MTSEDLRDALVEGTIDTLQVFPPMRIEYEVEDYKESIALNEVAQKALGSRSRRIAGEARNPQRLYKEIAAIFRIPNISLNDYLESGIDLPADIAARLESLIYNPEFGIPKSEAQTTKYIVEIAVKSDPEATVAGNDTACCMPFGDGKNTVYTFNPNCSQLLIQIVQKNGKKRTVAQSVVTKDKNMNIPIPNVTRALQQKTPLDEVLPETVLDKQEGIIACDNIEITPNFKGKDEVLELLYSDFFKEYVDQYGDQLGVEKGRVVIGMGYSDALTQLPKRPNTFAPQAPMSYSDNIDDEVYELGLQEKRKRKHQIRNKTVHVSQTDKKTPPALDQQITPLTFEDSLQVGFLESRIYKENDGLLLGLHGMENTLIAKDINNARQGRPNMSFAYRTSEGRLKGYLLAYEGKMRDISIADNPEYADQSCIYIMDFATDRFDSSTGMGGIKLIQAFIEKYVEEYAKKGKLLPIFSQMRGDTSYRLISRGLLNRFTHGSGVHFEVKELDSYQVGSDTMHTVIITPQLDAVEST